MNGMGDFVWRLVLMTIGALVTSVGLGQLARSRRGRAVLAPMKGWAVTGIALLFLAVSGGGLFWFVRRILGSENPRGFVPSAAAFLVLGLLVGLAFSLPGVFMGWSEARGGGKKKRTGPATRDDRRAFADQLAGQIREASDRNTEIVVRTGGDGERLLLIEGDLDSTQGNRLVTALRAEMKDLGFKRVEGTGPAGDWWAPV